MPLKILLATTLLFSFLNAKDEELKKIFEKFNINGTLVISSLKNNEQYIFNDTRAKERFTPASTFKIPHTLIALNEKIVSNENDIIKWDKVKRAYEVWNKDQTLKSAFLVSCVWCYKEFATHISEKKYLEYLEKFDYGNKKIGLDKVSFWLDDSLKISAYEQIDFLKKLYNNELFIDKKYMDTLKSILIEEENEKFTLRAKSGWRGKIGWYVGYVTTKDNIYFFAMNGDINQNQLNLRKNIVIEALKVKKII